MQCNDCSTVLLQRWQSSATVSTVTALIDDGFQCIFKTHIRVWTGPIFERKIGTYCAYDIDVHKFQSARRLSKVYVICIQTGQGGSLQPTKLEHTVAPMATWRSASRCYSKVQNLSCFQIYNTPTARNCSVQVIAACKCKASSTSRATLFAELREAGQQARCHGTR